MKTIKPFTYTQTIKFVSDWSGKENYLIQYRFLKFFIRHGMKVVKVHTAISFGQSKWLENYISFNIQNEIRLKAILKKISINY